MKNVAEALCVLRQYMESVQEPPKALHAIDYYLREELRLAGYDAGLGSGSAQSLVIKLVESRNVPRKRRKTDIDPEPFED